MLLAAAAAAAAAGAAGAVATEEKVVAVVAGEDDKVVAVPVEAVVALILGLRAAACGVLAGMDTLAAGAVDAGDGTAAVELEVPVVAGWKGGAAVAGLWERGKEGAALSGVVTAFSIAAATAEGFGLGGLGGALEAVLGCLVRLLVPVAE